jgi:divalent metal cation (Fe/Co/Zn/Cd) transporter
LLDKRLMTRKFHNARPSQQTTATKNGFARTSAHIHQALLLEWLTLGWMVIEAGVAIRSGFAARSLTLTAFGVDSVIELLSACVLLWRLNVELRLGGEFPEATEHRAARIGAFLLAMLSLYVVVSGVWRLWLGEGQHFSLPGLVLAAVALPLMYFLARAKLSLAEALSSASLRADAVESVACAYLSGVVVIGLVAQLAFKAWWIDGASALLLVPFLLREAREAWEEED